MNDQPHINPTLQALNDTSLTVDIIVNEGAWPIDSLEPFLVRLAESVYAHEGLQCVSSSFEVAVLLTNDEEVRGLNHDYRGKDTPTNVLSFPHYEASDPISLKAQFSEDVICLGDIAMAYETLCVEAKNQGKTFENHTAHLFIHGMLHLLGYDHDTDEKAAVMESKEIAILKNFGIPSPYEQNLE